MSEDQKIFWLGFAGVVVIAVALMVSFRVFGWL